MPPSSSTFSSIMRLKCPRGYAERVRFTSQKPKLTYQSGRIGYSVKRTRSADPRGHVNCVIEEPGAELGGSKSLYAESCVREHELKRVYVGQSSRGIGEQHHRQR